MVTSPVLVVYPASFTKLRFEAVVEATVSPVSRALRVAILVKEEPPPSEVHCIPVPVS